MISTEVCDELLSALKHNQFIIKFEFSFRHIHERDSLFRTLNRNQKRQRDLQRRKRMELRILESSDDSESLK